jgi:probable H4MPT-linked C1 transfer pathway protein
VTQRAEAEAAKRRTLGWDLGGAHVKAVLVANGTVRHVWQRPCPLWRNLDELSRTLREMAASAGPAQVHAVTMTGELADVFPDRAHGVSALLQTFRAAVPHGRIRVYAHPQRFVTAVEAARHPLAVASVNWSATAAWAARTLRDALLVDVGSTTTDILPIAGGALVARGTTDAQRLAREELVYTGVVRTPVMSLAGRIPFAGEWHAPMAEVFATSADVYRLTRELPPDADQMPSADGAGKSRVDSARRLARMLGRDLEMAPPAAWEQCARFLADAQLWSIQQACERVLSGLALPTRASVVGAGVGRFLVRKLARRLGRPYRDFSALLPVHKADAAWAASCAPAAAVALLAGLPARTSTRGRVGR